MAGPMGRLEGRAALVTGGASGIGRATARLFAREGAAVLVVDVDEDGMAETLEPLGASAAAAVVDVRDPDCGRTAEAAVDQHLGGRLDVLVNAAAIYELAPFLDLAEEAFRRTIEIVLRGTFLMTQ